jgi:lipid II:glycine glycyltransferase (peptidoglycan interpeptide bridge formation enzyme)
MLAGMKPKWRYNVRLAEKKGVVVSREGSGSLAEVYALYQETASRDGIAIHPLSYYETLFKTFEGLEGPDASPGGLSLWVARKDGEAIASIITLFHRRHATYLYGASSGEKRNLMPAYALQWSAIQAARDEGCVDYDFFGIPPDEDPRHPMAGLYLFKTGFGGRIVHRIGAVDIPLNAPAYYGFKLLESARLAWYKGLKKTLARLKRGRTGGQRKTAPSKA